MPVVPEPGDAEVPDQFLGLLRSRPCPLCGSTDDGQVFATAHLDGRSLDRYAFASRKRPELLRLRLICCPTCDLVYASPVPAAEVLAQAYRDAAFDTAAESREAARTYIAALGNLLPTLPDREGAIDVGTGDGAFLGELLDAGFSRVGGIEPSTAPITGAEERLAGLIEHGVFRADLRPAGSLSLVTCFQTIEHVPDPVELARDATRLLKPGGIMAIVCHDRRAAVNRLLGLRSPIVDVEHQQLFSPASVTRLLRGAGLVDVGHRTIRNRYPLRYWARLAPLPRRASELVERGLDRAGLGDRPLSLPVGNLLAWGRRAHQATGAGTRSGNG